MHTSLYADDAVIFMEKIKEDIEALSRMLQGFVEVICLVTNVQKSMVVPIRFFGFEFESIRHGFPTLRANFPIRYLELPLSVHRLRSGDLQFILGKMDSNLPI
jgi:hypothetical protein